tara:strand:+ start:1898 stop:2698 length:801 start_codon:yes stop_codon:yes gene_type:complete
MVVLTSGMKVASTCNNSVGGECIINQSNSSNELQTKIANGTFGGSIKNKSKKSKKSKNCKKCKKCKKCKTRKINNKNKRIKCCTNKKCKCFNNIEKRKKTQKKNKIRKSVKGRYPTLRQQMKDNPWMNEIIILKARKEKLSPYDKFLYNAMKKQPQPKGYLESLIKKKQKKFHIKGGANISGNKPSTPPTMKDCENCINQNNDQSDISTTTNLNGQVAEGSLDPNQSAAGSLTSTMGITNSLNTQLDAASSAGGVAGSGCNMQCTS